MAITFSATAMGRQTFTDPADARSFLREKPWMGVSRIDDEGDWEFQTINFGLLRFKPPIVWNEELDKVNGWEFVGMAELFGVYARKRPS